MYKATATIKLRRVVGRHSTYQRQHRQEPSSKHRPSYLWQSLSPLAWILYDQLEKPTLRERKQTLVQELLWNSKSKKHFHRCCTHFNLTGSEYWELIDTNSVKLFSTNN